jgi:hypothetical protein
LKWNGFKIPETAASQEVKKEYTDLQPKINFDTVKDLYYCYQYF